MAHVLYANRLLICIPLTVGLSSEQLSRAHVYRGNTIMLGWSPLLHGIPFVPGNREGI